MSLFKTNSFSEDIAGLLEGDTDINKIHQRTERWMCRIFVVLLVFCLLWIITIVTLFGVYFGLSPNFSKISDSSQRLATDFNTTAEYFVQDLSEMIRLGIDAVLVLQQCAKDICVPNYINLK